MLTRPGSDSSGKEKFVRGYIYSRWGVHTLIRALTQHMPEIMVSTQTYGLRGDLVLIVPRIGDIAAILLCNHDCYADTLMVMIQGWFTLRVVFNRASQDSFTRKKFPHVGERQGSGAIQLRYVYMDNNKARSTVDNSRLSQSLPKSISIHFHHSRYTNGSCRTDSSSSI